MLLAHRNQARPEDIIVQLANEQTFVLTHLYEKDLHPPVTRSQRTPVVSYSQRTQGKS